MTTSQLPEQWDSESFIDRSSDAASTIPDHWEAEGKRVDFENHWLHKLWRSRVKNSDNDLILCIAAASRSAGSGVGKSTLALQLAREFDASETPYSAEEKATLDANEFSQGLLNDREAVPDKSAIIYDEATGTLSSQGADKRRAMADSVMKISKALATLRYRQCTAIIVAQSTNWMDSRMRDVIDALILIQKPGRAVVYQPFRNDLKPSNEYNDRKGIIRWQPVPEDDRDYQTLEQMKRESTRKQVEEQEENYELSDEQKRELAKKMKKNGFGPTEIGEALDMSSSWASKHTKDVEA